MGTEIQYKNYLASYNSMRDINEDSNSSSWPRFYGEKPITNGPYYNNFTPRNVTDSYPSYNKDVLKQKMLEHEAIFKNQVYELHRLYRIQRDMMEEIKRKEYYKHQISVEASSSSSRLPSQIQSDQESQKWHISSFPLSNPGCSRPSIVGTADVINSPLSCTKRTIPLQNVGVLKDMESSRPSKIRKKLFDLQLPADEYIDPEDGEQVQENKDNNTKLFLGGKIECRVDNLKPNSHLRGSVNVADLNEPIQIEPSVDFLRRSAYRGQDLSGKWKSPFLGLPQETVPSSKSGGASNNLCVEKKGNGREWLSYMHDAGSNKSNMSPNKSNLNPIPQYLHPDKQILSSQLLRTTPNNNPNHKNQPFGVFASENSRGDMRGEKKGRVLEIPDRIQQRSNYSNNLESVLGSRISTSYPFVNNSSDFANSWSHPVSSWGNPNGNFTQKLTSVQRQPSFNSSLSRNSQPSDQTQEILGDSWHVSGSCRSNPAGLASEFPIRNGFYQGSSSGSKEQLSTSSFMDFKSSKDKVMNLNAFPPDSSNDAVDLDQLAVLPWLRAKLVVSTEPVSTNLIDLNSSNHTSTHDIASGLTEKSDSLGKRILGFPISGSPRASANDYPFRVPTASREEFEDMKANVKHALIDINVACDALVSDSVEASFADKGKDSKLATRRNIIDLNFCASEDEDEDQSSPSDVIYSGGTKIRVEIDLEADPVDLECEEQDEQHKQQEEDDIVRTAAEAMLAISSDQHINEANMSLDPYEASMADSLLSLFEAVAVSYDDLVKETISTVEIDYFEAMTLQLSETKEEDYMPNYTLPKIQETEETGQALLPTRTRRGQARRGRQRRDFQRDILPGLTTLSRPEITEDLQTFGGLMRATGHNWPVGSMRRNGGRGGAGRGRRRAVVGPQPVVPPQAVEAPAPAPATPPPVVHSIEVGLKDTNLTGWGKTTRRPRRQRCAAGNAIAVALT